MNAFKTVYYYKHPEGNWSEDPSSLHNRGFLFGDGLFETMVLKKGKIRFAEQHFGRLKEGLVLLGMDDQKLSSMDQIEQLVQEIAITMPLFRLRWNVFRGGQGKYGPTEDITMETLQIQPFQKPPSVKFNAYISPKVFISESPWSQCKSLSSITYVMAAKERQAMDMDEVILKNAKGYISEAGSSNLFWIKDGIYYTPSLTSSCIAGVGRSRVLQRLRDIGKTVLEGEFEEKDLLEAEKVITTNVTGSSYIYKIGDNKFDTTSDPWVESVFEGIH